MNLYAIRDKDTGQVYSIDEFLDLHNSEVVEVDYVRPYQPAWNEQNNPFKSSFELAQKSFEGFIRDNKIEPTEPCDWCDDMMEIGKIYRNVPGMSWRFCSHCGRSLIDEAKA